MENNKGGSSGAFSPKSKFSHRQKILDDLEKPAEAQRRQNETLIVKVDSGNGLAPALRSSAAMVLVSATKNNLERIAKQRFSSSQMKKLGFSLPTVIPERDIEYFRAAVMWFIKRVFCCGKSITGGIST